MVEMKNDIESIQCLGRTLQGVLSLRAVRGRTPRAEEEERLSWDRSMGGPAVARNRGGSHDTVRWRRNMTERRNSGEHAQSHVSRTGGGIFSSI